MLVSFLIIDGNALYGLVWQLVVLAAGLHSSRSHPDSPTVPEIEVTGGGRGAGDMLYHIHISDEINLK